MFLSAAAMFIGIGLSALSDKKTILTNNKQLEYGEIAHVVAARLEAYLVSLKQDVRLLADIPPLNAYLNSEPGSETNKLALEQVQSAFMNFSEKRGVYYQIRYLDENGQEIVRVDKITGEPFVVSGEKLQNKKDRYYFSDAIMAEPDVIYVSPLDLNIEGKEIENRGTAEDPQYVPVLRAAMKVFSQDGKERGIVITNIYAEEMLSRLDAKNYGTDAKLFLVDKDGHYLYNPFEKSKEFAFMFNRQDSLPVEHPSIWSGIQTASGISGSFYDENNSSQIAIYHKLYPTNQSNADEDIKFGSFVNKPSVDQDNQYYWTIFTLLDSNSLNNLGNAGSYKTLYGLIVSALSVMIIGYYSSQKIAANTQKLISDQEKFKLAVESTYDHVVITDPDGIVLYANKSVERITGFQINEILGKKAGSKELWGGLMPLETYQLMWKTIKTDKKPFISEVTNKRKNGEQYTAQATINPVLGRGGEVIFFVGVERDITHEKEVDKVKTEFVSLASHQLRTPLSAINWYAEMLLNGDAGKLSTDQQDFVQEIYKGNQRMVNLVNSLLNVSRLELGTFAVETTNVDLKQLIQEELKELQPKIAAAQHTVNAAISPDVPTIKADGNLLGMVVQNLLSNAVKYTPNKGQIEVTLRNVKAHEVVGKYPSQEDSILFSVKDNGYGIPASQQDRIFTKLFRADNIAEKDVEGTGLGLYIVKEIVELAEGQIWFESAENQGTNFLVLIPTKGMKPKTGTKKLS